MKFTTFAWPFAIVCTTIAAAVLLLRDPEPPANTSFASAEPPNAWPDYSAGGAGFKVPAGDDGPYPLFVERHKVRGFRRFFRTEVRNG